jgi:hypothetical protein
MGREDRELEELERQRSEFLEREIEEADGTAIPIQAANANAASMTEGAVDDPDEWDPNAHDGTFLPSAHSERNEIEGRVALVVAQQGTRVYGIRPSLKGHFVSRRAKRNLCIAVAADGMQLTEMPLGGAVGATKPAEQARVVAGDGDGPGDHERVEDFTLAELQICGGAEPPLREPPPAACRGRPSLRVPRKLNHRLTL